MSNLAAISFRCGAESEHVFCAKISLIILGDKTSGNLVFKCLIDIQRPVLVKILGLAPVEGLRNSHDHPVSSSLVQSFKDGLIIE